MRKAMRMFFFALLAGAPAAGVYGSNVFAQEENREKKVVATFGGAGIGPVGGPGIGLVVWPEIGVVKNAPFSGEMVCECIQTLADGNRIVHQTNTIIHRDGEGRIRRETSFKTRDANSGAYKEYKTIQISDPFGGQDFTLDPQNRTARKITTRSMKEIPGIMTFWPVGVGGVSKGVASGGAASAAGNACGPGTLRNFLSGVKVSLGSQMIEGVAAEGTRITHTIPTGSMGNGKPIEITYERWSSKDLYLDVLIKSVDTRSGESTQQMTKISRGEPDTALFEIPSDYTVEEITLKLPVLGGIGSDEAATANLLRENMRNPTEGLADRSAQYPMSASLKPTILYKVKASYTEEARQNRIEGVVVLNVVFAFDGTINSIRVVRGLPDGLTEKAIEAAKKTRFQPAVNNGVTVSVRGDLEFTFELYK
jgi:TonB family protein